MSRIIRSESRASARKKLLRHARSAIGQVNGNALGKGEQLDVFAFLSLSLARVDHSIQQTVSAWEDRGYWVKADRFSLEWDWVSRCCAQLDNALGRQDLAGAAQVTTELATHLAEYDPYRNDQKQRPWQGSWDQWQQRSQ